MPKCEMEELSWIQPGRPTAGLLHPVLESHFRGASTNKGFQGARKPEGNFPGKQLKDLRAFRLEERGGGVM